MTAAEIELERRIERAKDLRYKRPALAILSYEDLIEELNGIEDECADAAYLIETDKDGLLDALNGNEDEAFEFDMALQDISTRMYLLYEQITESARYDDKFGQTFNNCIVGLIGNRYNVVGYDGYEEDYYSLTSYESDLAVSEAGKRICRMTKADMLATIGQCMGIALAYIDIRNDYFTLKASFDIIKDHNSGILSAVKEIEKLYDRITSGEADNSDNSRFQYLCDVLPERIWIE